MQAEIINRKIIYDIILYGEIIYGKIIYGKIIYGKIIYAKIIKNKYGIFPTRVSYPNRVPPRERNSNLETLQNEYRYSIRENTVFKIQDLKFTNFHLNFHYLLIRIL